MSIPFIDLKEVNNHLIDDFKEQIDKLFESGQYILGQPVSRFEEHFVRYVSMRHGIAVNSGSDALILGMKALGIGNGDEVIMPAFASIPLACAVLNVGATPVFVDVRADSGCIDPDLCLHSINGRTKAIIGAHLFGQACEIDRLSTVARTYSVAVIEDMRHATGGRFNNRRLGSFGAVSCFSFYPTRPLGCLGDGGLVATGDEKVAERLRALRDRSHVGEKEELGLACHESRLDAIQALMLDLKLQEVDENNLERIENARLYTQLLEGSPVETPTFRDDNNHIYSHYTIKAPDREKLAEHLTAKEIGHKVYYPKPLHLHPIMANLEYKEGAYPVAEDLSRRSISLPIFPGMKKRQIETVVSAVKEFYGVTAE